MGSALIEIIVMLFVSAVLGFAIAWFIQKSKLDKLQTLYDQKVSDYNILDHNYNDLDKRYNDLQEKNTSLESDLALSRTEITGLNSKIENLQSDLLEKVVDIDKLTSELKKLDVSIKGAAEENENLNAIIIELREKKKGKE